MEADIAGMLAGEFGDSFNFGKDQKVEEDPGPRKQLSDAQSKALLEELNGKQREELCSVLRAQSQGEKDLRMTPELARILQRFQRRAGLGADGHGRDGEETWPMYLGIVLFFVISVVFIYIYIQEQGALEQEEIENDEDPWWLLREF
ncbi:unnamed protein product [Polarella glacialis]|uniref:Uncharacterized protein n=1 Tax=Polarella glacialis TaxID=89957 RepID=A0A813E3A4_POLGL|nr:unnamed protein product [Polarella glacialis]|mmetsp:Transcript_35750/g.57616  ORF Transcript_35750/g.57616 Transcript_35750/m.57616 type:complete len:147 (+) Transcript_35750:221-661(+)|eukprot:CAMPEP_0115064846 /NCGR_PEP_ID=MMETSP0227-20121206/9921_1 /TAXON_ID=89957 /ORGANISM="Polarella glacialis, Strain CCMP 1383" /LENGTH=146 /DNA_ID=CAMNT_0002450567 /DNA_START=55 /DNA_END=495 /DNA_ORIENTATION=-